MESVDKTLDVMELFLDNPEEMSLTEMSRLSGINKTTIFRIVSTLLKRGYVKQRDKRGKYELGTIYLNYSSIVKNRMQLRKIVTSYLTKLALEINQSVAIAYANGIENFSPEYFQVISHPRQTLSLVPNPEYGIPLHCTALGKIILSSFSEEELQRYFKEKKPEKFTRNTITDYYKMKAHLLKVKEQGVAFENEEYFSGIKGFAVGVKDSEAKITAAIGTTVLPTTVTHAKVLKLVPVVKNCAANISKEIGFRGID